MNAMRLNYRLRATQTELQIGAQTASVTLYDHLDRVVATGEWKHGKDEASLRSALLSDETDENNKGNFPTEKDLTPGTVTRTYYDKMPDCDILGVKLCPDGMGKDDFHYLRGRVAAVVSS